MFGGQSTDSAMVSSYSICKMRKLGCKGVQSLIQSHMVGSEPTPGGQAKEVGFPAGLVAMGIGHGALLISDTGAMDAHGCTPCWGCLAQKACPQQMAQL